MKLESSLSKSNWNMKYQTQQLNKCSKLTIAVQEQCEKYVQN